MLRFAVVGLILAASPSAAQPVTDRHAPAETGLRVIFSLDLDSLGMGQLTEPVVVETDGNPNTYELLVQRIFTNQHRVLSFQPSGWCFSDWFPLPYEWSPVTISGLTFVKRFYVEPSSTPLQPKWKWDVAALPQAKCH